MSQPRGPTLPADFVGLLAREHQACGIPSGIAPRTEELARGILALLFPQHDVVPNRDAASIGAAAGTILGRLADLIGQVQGPPRAAEFMAALPAIHRALGQDAGAHYDGDPAATTLDEVILAYPGFRAIALYRIAHALWTLDIPLIPRLVSELGHRDTGIDIHPGATIGATFSIDHGTGVVIGETAVIGDRVKLYQGVTLGSASVRKDLAHTRRHPTVGNDVVIYANATILGGDTVIGDGSIIGGNVWLTKSVAPGSVVSHEATISRRRVPARADDLLEFHI